MIADMTRDELVRAVIADPWDMTAREAFAAWGVANHDPQGELTWLQLARRRERRSGTTEAAARAGAAASVLVRQHYVQWVRDVVPIASSPSFGLGFVDSVVLDAPTFLERADELFAMAPIRAIQFVDVAKDIGAIAASPHLARLVSMNFYNRSGASALGDWGLRTLLESPHVARVAFLRLGSNRITRAGVELLASQRLKLPNLVEVSLGNNLCEDPQETAGMDEMGLGVVNSSISLPVFGQQLEATYGEIPWLHPYSRYPAAPPEIADF